MEIRWTNLPIEFARISNDVRLTLVITKRGQKQPCMLRQFIKFR
jgi:hypothetical protein